MLFKRRDRVVQTRPWSEYVHEAASVQIGSGAALAAEFNQMVAWAIADEDGEFFEVIADLRRPLGPHERTATDVVLSAFDMAWRASDWPAAREIVRHGLALQARWPQFAQATTAWHAMARRGDLAPVDPADDSAEDILVKLGELLCDVATQELGIGEIETFQWVQQESVSDHRTSTFLEEFDALVQSWVELVHGHGIEVDAYGEAVLYAPIADLREHMRRVERS